MMPQHLARSSRARAAGAGTSGRLRASSKMGAGPSPHLPQIRARLSSRKAQVVLRTLELVIVVAAVCVLISTFFISVLQVRGNSMEPTFYDGDLVITSHSHSINHQDPIAFYYNNKVLLKRVIGISGDWVDIRDDGTVAVNGTVLTEDYAQGISTTGSELTFPYQVPEGRYFVLGDHRSVSVDSRSSVGVVSPDQILGKPLFVIWPLNEIGPVN